MSTDGGVTLRAPRRERRPGPRDERAGRAEQPRSSCATAAGGGCGTARSPAGTGDGRPEPVYVIRHAESSDGVPWQPPATGCLEPRLPRARPTRAPWVLRDGGTLPHVVLLPRSRDYRDDPGHSYRIGYAESTTGSAGSAATTRPGSACRTTAGTPRWRPIRHLRARWRPAHALQRQRLREIRDRTCHRPPDRLRAPAFAEPRHVGRANVGDRERLSALIDGALDRSWLTNDGPLVDEFERRVAELSGTEHCVAVSNATVGLQLVARALDLSGQVIVPVVHVHRHRARTELDRPRARLRARSTATRTRSTRRPSRRRSPRPRRRSSACTSGAAPAPSRSWRRSRGARAAAASSTPRTRSAAPTRGGRSAGIGDAAVFSFHATKVVSAAEGGAITTNDEQLAAPAAARCATSGSPTTTPSAARHEREDERALRRHRHDLAGVARRLRRGEPPQLRRATRRELEASPGCG